jgi:hypothetical protein
VKYVAGKNVLGLVGSLLAGGLCARAELEVAPPVSIRAVADFQEPLSACGTWLEVSPYGRCWRPADVALDWRPYGDGRWEWTECGWFWLSQEPWAWAGYHYGHWICDPVHRWIWIPGIEWAPAWVSWRVGSDFVGWAPLPPRRGPTVPARFVFVAGNRFCDRVKPANLLVEDAVAHGRTKSIRGIRRELRQIGGAGPKRWVVVNEGPGVEWAERAVGEKLKPAPILELVQQTPLPLQMPRNDAVEKQADPECLRPSVLPTDRRKERLSAGKAWPPGPRPNASWPQRRIPQERSAPAALPNRKLPGVDWHPGPAGMVPPPALPENAPAGVQTSESCRTKVVP